MSEISLIQPYSVDMNPGFPDWKGSNYFKEVEDRGESALVHPVMPRALDLLRQLLQAPVMVSPSPGALVATDGHSDEPPSWHYIIPGRNTRGMAADIMVATHDLLSAFLAAQKIVCFGGIGVYPFWKPKPGLHVDLRPYTERAIWWRDETGEYHYPKNHYEWKSLFEEVL